MFRGFKNSNKSKFCSSGVATVNISSALLRGYVFAFYNIDIKNMEILQTFRQGCILHFKVTKRILSQKLSRLISKLGNQFQLHRLS